MSDETAFLTALKANPLDDTARLIYSDWLDERDEPGKAEYLRRVVALAQREGNLATDPEATPLLKLAEQLPEEWRTSAGARFALVLSGYTDKIQAIKWLREITGDELVEAKEASEHLPHVVLACDTYEYAVAACSRFGRSNCINTFIAPSVSGPVAADATYDLVVRCNVYTTQQDQQETDRAARTALTLLLAAAREVSEAEAEPLAALEQDIVLATGLTPQEARIRRNSFSHLAPPYDPKGHWYIVIRRLLRPTPTNPE